MTEEELKNVEQATNLIVENGFVIKNTDSFIRAIDNTKLEDIINRLNALSASVSEGINVSDFVNKITEKLNSIEELTNNDPYFRSSISANDFQNLVTNMREKFTLSKTLSKNCAKALEILEERKENLKDINKRVKELEMNSSIDDVTRTSETVKLSVALNHAKNATKEAEEFYKEQKKLYDESLKISDVVEYRNELLKAINALDDSYRKLSMEPATMDKMANLIRVTRDEIVVFGFEAQKSQKEFDELCKKFGLEKNDARVIAPKQKEDELIQPVEQPTPTIEPTITEPSKPEPSIKDLAKEMKLLNSHIEISTDEQGFVDGILYDGESKLALPKGFSYDKVLGINNKVDDKTPYISLPVKVKELVKPEEPAILEPTVPEQTEPTMPKKGTKHKVKRIRRAVVAPYVNATLCFTGLATIVGALAGASLVPVAALGASVGAIGQAIYNKMAAAGIVDKENENARENDTDFKEKVWGLAAIDSLITKGKGFFNKLKEAKERKNSEPTATPTPELEQPKSTPELNSEPEETLETPDNSMSYEELFDQKVNSILNDLDENDRKKQAASENNQNLPNISGEEYNIEPEQSLGGR